MADFFRENPLLSVILAIVVVHAVRDCYVESHDHQHDTVHSTAREAR